MLSFSRLDERLRPARRRANQPSRAGSADAWTAAAARPASALRSAARRLRALGRRSARARAAPGTPPVARARFAHAASRPISDPALDALRPRGDDRAGQRRDAVRLDPERRERLAPPAPVALDQDLRRAADLALEEARHGVLARRAQARRPLLARRLGHLRHARGRRAAPRREGKDVQMGQSRLVDQLERLLRTSPRSRSGSRRSGRRRTRCPAAAPASRAHSRTTSARPWRRFMRFRIRSSPACTLRCRCGIRRGSVATRSTRSGSTSAGSIEDRRRRGSSGTRRSSRRDQLAERGLARQVLAVGGQVDPGQHDLAVAGVDQAARLLDHLARRHAPARAAAIGNDAERAAVIAAVLHLDEGARAAVEAVDQVARPSRARS